MPRKSGFVGRFFQFFRWYLVLLALAAHVALAGAVVLVLVLGPGRSLEAAKAAARKVRALAQGEVERLEKAREARVEGLLGEAVPDVFRFRDLPDARSATLGYGRVLTVRPGAPFARPSQAARAARNGDVIEIAGGDYPGDTAIWSANDLLIRAVGGVARLNPAGAALPQHKAIWIVQGNNIRIENVEFAHARSRDRNGAGIRAEGDALHVVSCFFHDNESGLMTSNHAGARLRVEYSEFARNGHPSGQAHQIYVGTIDELELRGNYIHETLIGSAVKSRARRSTILYNRIVDEGRGRSNYTIDLSVGGEAYVVGNVLQQGPATENYTLVTFAPEGLRWDRNHLLVAHNTIVNDRSDGNFVRNHSREKALVVNNLLLGKGSPAEGPAVLVGNLVDAGKGLFGRFDASLGGLPGSGENRFAEDVEVADRSSYDYRLRPGSPAVDAAAPLPSDAAKTWEPLHEYRHPLRVELRPMAGAPDVGAHEYAP
ncbi:MAG: right-handed parallel beta-helix repeat-containing protein [Thermodesulfobacteriota bacterium]